MKGSQKYRLGKVKINGLKVKYLLFSVCGLQYDIYNKYNVKYNVKKHNPKKYKILT